jgi:Icc-related predicted phosphoesterase
MHIGSFSIGQWVSNYQPKLHCCGHVHEAAGKETKIGKTLCFNPGPKGRMIEI